MKSCRHRRRRRSVFPRPGDPCHLRPAPRLGRSLVSGSEPVGRTSRSPTPPTPPSPGSLFRDQAAAPLRAWSRGRSALPSRSSGDRAALCCHRGSGEGGGARRVVRGPAARPDTHSRSPAVPAAQARAQTHTRARARPQHTRARRPALPLGGDPPARPPAVSLG